MTHSHNLLGEPDPTLLPPAPEADAELASGATPAEARAASEAGIPARRYGTPAEFAAVVAFLASAPASYVTGEQIRCDGGMVRAY